jgi:hypothetical protein
LNFEVNKRAYVLHFESDRGRWFLITENTIGGMKAIPVINDDEINAMPTMIVPVGGEGHAQVN